MSNQYTEGRDEADREPFVNYMPGMPTLSTEPGRVERFLARLLRRRGGLRPVARERADGE